MRLPHDFLSHLKGGYGKRSPVFTLRPRYALRIRVGREYSPQYRDGPRLSYPRWNSFICQHVNRIKSEIPVLVRSDRPGLRSGGNPLPLDQAPSPIFAARSSPSWRSSRRHARARSRCRHRRKSPLSSARTSISTASISPGACSASAEKNCRNGAGTARLFQGEASRLPFRAEVFDCVFHVGGINFFSDPNRAIREMIWVAKPGTKIVISDETEDVVTQQLPEESYHEGILSARQRTVRCPIDLVPEEMQEIQGARNRRRQALLPTFRKPQPWSIVRSTLIDATAEEALESSRYLRSFIAPAPTTGQPSDPPVQTLLPHNAATPPPQSSPHCRSRAPA